MLMDKAMSGSGIVHDKYITVSVIKQSYEEAKTFFARVSADLTTRLARLSSKSTELRAKERLRIFHDFFRIGHEEEYRLKLSELMKKGHSFIDSVCPDSVSFKKDYITIGDNFARTLTTESTAVLNLFRAQEINHMNGIYCGQNAISKNLIFVNRFPKNTEMCRNMTTKLSETEMWG